MNNNFANEYSNNSGQPYSFVVVVYLFGVSPSQNVSPDPEVILCNNMKMLRERLSVSGAGLGAEHREQENDYVYDLYYQETAQAGWIQDILSIRAYGDEGELVCGRTDGWTDTDGRVDGWADGWLVGMMDEWMAC